jgi:hypothetical protein
MMNIGIGSHVWNSDCSIKKVTKNTFIIKTSSGLKIINKLQVFPILSFEDAYIETKFELLEIKTWPKLLVITAATYYRPGYPRII